MDYGIILKDPAMKRYFDALPAAMQENLIHSGVQMKNLEELENCARSLTPDYLPGSGK